MPVTVKSLFVLCPSLLRSGTASLSYNSRSEFIFRICVIYYVIVAVFDTQTLQEIGFCDVTSTTGAVHATSVMIG